MYNNCPSLIRFSSQTVAKPQKLLYENITHSSFNGDVYTPCILCRDGGVSFEFSSRTTNKLDSPYVA